MKTKIVTALMFILLFSMGGAFAGHQHPADHPEHPPVADTTVDVEFEGGDAEATAGVEGSGNGTAAVNFHIGGDKIRPRSSAPGLTSGPNCTGSTSVGLGGVISAGGTKEGAGCAAWRNVKEMSNTEKHFAWTENSYNAVMCGYSKMNVAMAWAGVDCKAVLAGPQKLKDQRRQEADEVAWGRK